MRNRLAPYLFASLFLNLGLLITRPNETRPELKFDTRGACNARATEHLIKVPESKQTFEHYALELELCSDVDTRHLVPK